jgi:glycosyltransferase involved in cell wall biosynthesis
MRILLLTPFLPDPAVTHGGGIYLGTLARALGRRVEIGLVALAPPDEQARLLADRGPWTFAATARLPERPTGRGRTGHQLRMLWRWRGTPLVAAKHWHPEVPGLLDRARREFAPDVVLVELAQMAQYLPHVRDLPTVLTDHEAGAPGNTRTGLGEWGDQRDRRLWQRYVRRFYPLATLVQAVTREDADTLARLLGRDVPVRPPTFAVPEQPVAPERAPPRALFLGDYRHAPNPEAATRLVREVFPHLRAQDPDAELWLAGPNQQLVQPLAGVPGVRLLGYVPDLAALFAQVRLLLAPLFSGGGFRMKSLAALAHGLPVVTNALGARGCSAPAPARTVAEGPAALAAATLGFLRSPALAADAGRAAFAWAQANLTADAVAEGQLAQLDALLRRSRG